MGFEFKNLPDRSTPLKAQDINKLNNINIGSAIPAMGEDLWIDTTEKNLKIRNGQNYNVFNVKREVFTASLETQLENTLARIIPLTKLSNSSTNRITISDGKIRIGSGIKKVLVSGQLFGSTYNNNTGYIYTSIKLNNISMSYAIAGDSAFFAQTCHAPFLLDVKEGDLISLSKEDQTSTLVRSGGNTFITVEIIE